MAAFKAAYGAKFGKAVAKITDDLDELLAFYDFPAEHWIHLRTTDEIVNPLLGRGLFWVLFLSSAAQPEIAGPEPGSGWSARSAARTYDLDRGEDRRSVRRRWAWSDPVAKSRVWGCQPCRAASPRGALKVAPQWWRPRPPPICAPFCAPSFGGGPGGLPGGDHRPVGRLGLSGQIAFGGPDRFERVAR